MSKPPYGPFAALFASLLALAVHGLARLSRRPRQPDLGDIMRDYLSRP